MRLRALALAPALVLLAACGGGGDTAESGSPAGAGSEVDWNYIRAQHSDTLANISCLSDATSSAVDCNRERSESLASLRADVERLPDGASKSDMLGSIDHWDEKYAEYTGKECVGTVDTTLLPCALDESLLNVNMLSIASAAKNSAG